MNLRDQAQNVAAAGRGPDTVLVHMSPEEVRDISRMGLAAGIGPVGINPDTGYPEAGFFGDLFKGLASALPGVLGTAFLSPFGGALLQGLFTGATQDNWKKGLLAGLGTYMGGKALTGAVEASRAKANMLPALASPDGSVTMPAIQAVTQQQSPGLFQGGVEFLKDIPGTLMDTGAIEQGFGDAFSGRSGMMIPAIMKEVDASIMQDEARREGESIDDYMDRLRAVREERRRTYGSNPYAGLYSTASRGYAAGGQVGPGMDYNRFQQGGPVRYGGPMMHSQYGDYDPRLGGDEGGYGPPSYGDQKDPRTGEPIMPGAGGGGGGTGGSTNPNDAGTGRGNMAWTPLQSYFPPQGYIPGLMPEFMYIGPQGQESADPTQSPQYGGFMGGNPFGFNPFGQSGFSNPFGMQQNRFFGPPNRFGGSAGPFGMPFNPFLGMGGMSPFGPIGGGGLGGFGFGGFSNPYARRSPWGFAQGGQVNPNGGLGDGIDAAIVGPDGSMEPAMLSPGEYVIPADVVSMIGDGDSDAGADELDAMMGRVRMHKTGSPQQLPPMDLNILPG